MKSRNSVIALVVIVSFAVTSCLRDVLDVLDVFGISPIVPEADNTTFWYKLHYEKDTLLYPLEGDTSYICDKTEYRKPVESRPYHIETIYEFGFNHLIDSNGRKHATFIFTAGNFDNNSDYFRGRLISDTSFFEEGKKYFYISIDKRKDSYFQYCGHFSNTPAFWYAFYRHGMDNDTSYTLSFEVDRLLFKNSFTDFDTLHIRNGRLSVSRKYEDYVRQNKKRIEYNYQTSEGFIK